MTADTALRLEKWLEVSADFWLSLQKRYELDSARDKAGDMLSAIQPMPRSSHQSEMQLL